MSLASDIVDLANDFEKMFFEDPLKKVGELGLKKAFSEKNLDSYGDVFSFFDVGRYR